MKSISPDYYASGQRAENFTLTGERFIIIPDTAIGVLAGDNDKPLENRYSNNAGFLYEVSENSGTSLLLTCRDPSGFSNPHFLGGIVSADREIVYWVNETRPLP